LSDYADSPANIEDSLYGNLVAQRTFRNEDGTLSYNEINTVPCERSYIQEKFYPARTFIQDQIEFNHQKLHCLAPDSTGLAVFGDYDDPQSATISVFFASCDTLWQANCKTVE